MSDEDAPELDRDSVIKIGDNPYVQYDGLLDYAHQSGMTSLISEVVQLPHESNGNLCVFKATAVFESGGQMLTFVSHGSAHAGNVRSKNMQVYLIEMADTRAKARAMRDGCNIGTVVDVEMAGSQISEKPAVAKPATAGNTGLINNSGAQCPSCRAPNGKPHAAKCDAVSTPVVQPEPLNPAPAPSATAEDDAIAVETSKLQKSISDLCSLMGKPRYATGATPDGWRLDGLWRKFARTPYTAAVTIEEHRLVEKRMRNTLDSILNDAAQYKDAQEFVNAANVALGMQGDTMGDWTLAQFDAAVVWLKTGRIGKAA